MGVGQGRRANLGFPCSSQQDLHQPVCLGAQGRAVLDMVDGDSWVQTLPHPRGRSRDSGPQTEEGGEQLSTHAYLPQ